jgi:hypothetical protein
MTGHDRFAARLRDRRPGIGLATLALLGIGLTSCHRAPSLPSAGQSSIRFVTAPPPPSAAHPKFSVKEGPPSDMFVDAMPIGTLASPDYPAAALAAHAGLVNVGVRITVDVGGRVSNVAPSLVALSIPNRFSRDFEAAVEAAVGQWRFKPAKIRHFEEAPDGESGTYTRVAREEKIETDFDVAFTFTAAGGVLSVPSGKNE